MKKSRQPSTQSHRNTRGSHKATISPQQAQTPETQKIEPRFCPNCGKRLPAQARYCANCGRALATVPAQAPASTQTPESASLAWRNSEKETQNRSASRPPKKVGSAGNSEKQSPASQSSKNAAATDNGGKRASTSAASQEAPAKNSGKREAQAVLEVPHTPPTSETPKVEEQQTLLLPPPLHTPPPRPVESRQIEEQKTLFLPPSQQTAAPKGAQSIEEQETLALLPEKPASQPTQAQAPGQQALPPSSQGKPGTLPGSNGEKKAPGGPSGTPPETPASQTGTPTGSRRARQIGDTGPQNPQSLASGARRVGDTGPRLSQPLTSGARRVGDTGPKNPLSQTLPRISANLPTKLLAPSTPAGKVKNLIWPVLSPLLARAQDPEPEKQEEPEPGKRAVNWLPLVVVMNALGLFTIATAYNAARNSAPGAEIVFWLGAGLIFVPALIRLILPRASRVERILLLCMVALCLYLAKVELSPLHFSGYDELLHWRTVNDILSTGHLFNKNPLLPVSPYYPGLEIVTSALSTISGLSVFQAGSIVIGTASLVMILALYLLCELLSGSARLASIATIIYMTNPHFFLFDHQFAYESLALPLATFVLYLMARYEMLNKSRPWVMLVAWLVLTAMDVTHHATNFVFEGLFALWAAVYLFLRPLPVRKSIVIPTVIFGMVLTVATVLLIGTTVISYFTSFFADVGSEVAQTLGSNGNGSRQLFSTAGAVPTPLLERLISLGAVGLITLAIPFLLLCFWRRYRQNTLTWVFAIIVVFYPVLQVLRLTTSGAELSDRTSAFVFIAISFLAAVAIVQFWPIRLLKWRQSTLICVAVLVLFMGGIILGDGTPPSFMPGPYEVSADARSIEPEGIQAALWAQQHLGPNNRMYTDRINQELMSTYGEQYLVTKIGDNIDVTDVFFSPSVGNYEISLLQKGKIHYLVVDMRLSKGLPQDGFYFEAGEPGANAEAKPLNPEYLTKFDTVPQINRLFDSGNIAIYDTGGLLSTH